MTGTLPGASSIEARARRLDGALRRLERQLGAESVALIDLRTGTVLRSVGRVRPTESAPELVDAYVSGAWRLASLVTDVEFTSLAHRGHESAILLREVEGGWIVMVVVRGPAATAPEAVRLDVLPLRRLAVHEKIVAEGEPASEAIRPGWAEVAEATIEQLLREGG